MKLDIVPLVVAILGAGGIGAFFRDALIGLSKLRRGVSARETKRRIDIVQQRDEAIDRAYSANERAEMAERNVASMREYTTDLRIRLREQGVPFDQIPAAPDLERTMPADRIRQVRRESEEGLNRG